MLEQKFNGDNSDRLLSFDEREGTDAEKRALRVLLDSFHTKPETLLEKTFDNPATRRKIGKFIGGVFIKPYGGER